MSSFRSQLVRLCALCSIVLIRSIDFVARTFSTLVPLDRRPQYSIRDLTRVLENGDLSEIAAGVHVFWMFRAFIGKCSKPPGVLTKEVSI